MYVVVNYPKFKAWTSAGVPAVGYKVYSYEANTSTPVNTYSDRLLTTPNTNPVTLDSNGEAVIYVGQPVKIVLKTSAGATVWTFDYLGEIRSDLVTGASSAPTSHNNYVVDVTPAIGAMSDRMMLIMTPDMDNSDTIGAETFTGTGINDGIFSGPYIGSTSGSTFTVEIDSCVSVLDTYIKLLLHNEGSGATFADSSAGGKTVTANGDVTQSTGWYKFGTKSALFDGAGDYLSLADHADWNLGSGDFTIEFWVYFNTVGNCTFWGQHADANNTAYFDYSGGSIRFYFKDASTPRANYDYSWSPDAATAYHIELVRSGTNLYLYIDGVKVTWTTTITAIGSNALGDIAGALTIGYGANVGTYLAGYIDEFVWSKGIARNTGASFTLATQAYVAGGSDTFRWKKDGGAWTTGVSITTAAQSLIEGVKIQFADFTGHTLGDIWAVDVETPAKCNLCSLGNYIIYKNEGGSLVSLDAGDLKANIPATLVFSNDGSCWVLNNPSAPVLDTQVPYRARKKIRSNYDVLAADHGQELSCQGTITVTLPDPPDVVSKFFYITCESGTTTIDAGTYSIYGPTLPNGATSLIISQFTAVQLATNGIDWHVMTEASGGTGMLFLDTPGDTTWIAPKANVHVIACAGGGSGQGGITGGAAGEAGCPGQVKAALLSLTPGETYTLTVGDGGAAVTADQNGNAGEDTEIVNGGTVINCSGGIGGSLGCGCDLVEVNPLATAYGNYGAGGAGGAPGGGTSQAGADGFLMLTW